MKNEGNLRLEKYKESLKSAWGYNDYNDWPIKVNSIMHLFLKEFAQECLEDMNEIKEKKIDIKEVTALFNNPARLYRLIDSVIFGMKRLGLPLHEQRNIVHELLDMVSYMKAGDEFNEPGKNIIMNKDELNTFRSETTFRPATQADAAIIQKFCGIMWAYTESIFFRAHEVTKEVHGAYELGEGQQMIVREYLNLQPDFLWGNQVPFLKYKKIQVSAIYNSELKLRIDSYNHLFLERGNYITCMTHYSLLGDGKPIEIKELSELIVSAFQTINTIHEWTAEQDWRTLANKYADIYWYRKSPFRLILNKDVKVPDHIREKIMNGEPDSRRVNNLTDEMIDRLIRIVI
ncbi:MAG: hypothetical protein ACYDG2_00855 [Ruminiclostridium sp.]